MDGLYLNIR